MTPPSDIIARYLGGRPFEESGRALLVPTGADTVSETVATLTQAPLPLLSMFATDERARHDAFRIHYVFGVPGEPYVIVPVLSVPEGTTFPSLAKKFAVCALYEREIMTLFGLLPEGHPDPRLLILFEENWPRDTYPLRKDFAWDTRVPETHTSDYRFKKIGGEGIYEIPVGPVHAGIIEPGHFRFSVLGEEIVSLEPRLGWVHKGTEKLFEGASVERATSLAEHVSGDSAFSHGLALAQALEQLTNTDVPPRARHLRLIFAELERITMHIFDIGNIAGNGTGFSFMAAQGFRLVEGLRRLSEELTGHRFLRGVIVPRGVTRDLNSESIASFEIFLRKLRHDFSQVIEVANGSASLANRLKGTGIIGREVMRDYGASGVPARAAGIKKDARIDYPYAAYNTLAPEICLTEKSDVDARFHLRIKEVFASINLVEEALRTLPEGTARVECPALPAQGFGIGVVEGWRGEIVYVVKVEDGAISRIKVRDPSFIHWQLISHLSSKDMVPDFPLINKSLNLSYSGNDL